MLTIKLELDQDKISEFIGTTEPQGAVFTACEGEHCVAYGIFQTEEDTVCLCRCHYNDPQVLDGIVRAAFHWAVALGAECYDITRADEATMQQLLSMGYHPKGRLEELKPSCGHK